MGMRRGPEKIPLILRLPDDDDDDDSDDEDDDKGMAAEPGGCEREDTDERGTAGEKAESNVGVCWNSAFCERNECENPKVKINAIYTILCETRKCM